LQVAAALGVSEEVDQVLAVVVVALVDFCIQQLNLYLQIVTL
jgi:hypothetical protein